MEPRMKRMTPITMRMMPSVVRMGTLSNHPMSRRMTPRLITCFSLSSFGRVVVGLR
jgi:hypothetical protein